MAVLASMGERSDFVEPVNPDWDPAPVPIAAFGRIVANAIER